jgi:hypothetical protein
LTMAWFGWQQFRPPAVTDAAPQVTGQSAATEPKMPAPAERARTPVEGYTAPPQSPPATDSRPAEASERRSPVQAISEYQAPDDETATVAAGEPEQAEPSPARPDAAAEPEPQKQPASAAARAPYQPDAMSYWELPQGVRDSLPQFRISVIVYADRPEDRFVLVNGVRLKEKDELQSGVVLEEIRREGAVFRARNYRFLVKG